MKADVRGGDYSTGYQRRPALRLARLILIIPAFYHCGIVALWLAGRRRMYITVTHYKGGVAKTTTAVHLAAYLQRLAPTVLIDGDPIRSATKWAANGKGLPFTVVDREEGDYQARNFTHVVKDTEARPGFADFEKIVRGCDLLIIPTEPFDMEAEALKETMRDLKPLQANGKSRFRVLFTKVPPPAEDEAKELRAKLMAAKVPLFKAEIPYLKCFKKAFSLGVPVYDVRDPRAARAWQAYESAAREIV
jgi:chromosome partitioning protein